MKFRSTSDQPLHVALTSGHTALITPEGTDVDAMFLREAVARGAVPMDADVSASTQTQMLSRQLSIKEALNTMLNGADKDDFTADGKPNLVRLKAKAGFAVTREEADTVFAELVAIN